MESKLLRKIDVFISSPSDVKEERDAALRVISKLNKLTFIANNFILHPLAYEEIVPPAIGDSPQRTVDKYMMEAGKSDIFICIMWSRMGTPVIHEQTKERFESGTEYEFIDAYRSRLKNGTPQILLYRGMKPLPNNVDVEQVEKVRSFFTKFEGENPDFKGLYKSYDDTKHLEETLFNDIERIIATHFSPLDITKPQELIEEDPNVTPPFQADSVVDYDIKGCNTVKISIIQFFRMVDVLTQPSSVKAKGLYKCITNPSSLRRYLNGTKKVKLGSLGKLKPIVRSTEKQDRFWTVGLPRLDKPSSRSVVFFPFQISLTERLRSLSYLEGSLDKLPIERLENISNKQISGHIRIYPPGVGVMQFNLTLTFAHSADAEILGLIAHDFETQLFVDPEGLEKPCESIFIDEIERLTFEIFGDQGLTFTERRWRPPFTAFMVYDNQTLDLHSSTRAISSLLLSSPMYFAKSEKYISTVATEITDTRWQRDGILTLASNDVTFLHVSHKRFANRKKAKIVETWLAETTELALAVVYAYATIMEELDELTKLRTLNETWLPGTKNFEYLDRLLNVALEIFRAIASVEDHLKKQGNGALVVFSEKIWQNAGLLTQYDLRQCIAYVNNWVSIEIKVNNEYEGERLLKLLLDINSIDTPFKKYL